MVAFDDPPPGPRHRPQPGEPQPLQPGLPAVRRSQGGGGAGFVNVNGRLFAPLQGLDANNVLQGGYGWLDKTDGGVTFHPGVDLNSGGSCNADQGLPVVAPLSGWVRATLYWDGHTPGEGSHVWVELDDPCLPGVTWWHTDHLQGISVGIGQHLQPGDPIGTCGRSGGWDCAHAHTELLKGPPRDGWWQWPYGWPREQVEAAYWDPKAWWNAASALVTAEADKPIEPEAVMLLEDWQVRAWILGPLYAAAGIDYNPDSGTAQGWVSALRGGIYLGRPRTGEQPYGEGADRGVWVEYEQGVLCYRLSDGEWSVIG